MTVRVLDGCIKCGACQRACPVLNGEGREAFPGPRRLAVEAPRFGSEIEELSDPLILCTTCERCRSACPSQLPLPQAVVALRARMPSTPTEGRRRMQENFDVRGRVVEGELVERQAEGDLAYFPGCISEARLPEAVDASLVLLRAVGAHPYFPKGWMCCGSPLEKIGDLSRLERAEAGNAEVLDGVPLIVTSCPGCTVQLQRRYGKAAYHLIEHLHLSGRFSPRLFDPDAPPVRVALHSPCHLSRVVGPHTMEMALELLSLIPGVTVVEHDGEGECCGGGGGVAASRPEVAARMAGRKVISAIEAGADLMVAPCPFCVINLRRVGGFDVQELSTFIAGRLAVRQYP